MNRLPLSPSASVIPSQEDAWMSPQSQCSLSARDSERANPLDEWEENQPAPVASPPPTRLRLLPESPPPHNLPTMESVGRR
jgi:hypothetical protein